MLEDLILLVVTQTPGTQGAKYLTALSVVRMARATAIHSKLAMHNPTTATINEGKVVS